MAEIESIVKSSGSIYEVPQNDLYAGKSFFETSNKLPIIYSGENWLKYDGEKAYNTIIDDNNIFESSKILAETSYTASQFISQTGIVLSKDLVHYFEFKFADDDDFLNVQMRRGTSNDVHFAFGYDWVSGVKDGKSLSVFDQVANAKVKICECNFHDDFSKIIIWYDSKWGYFNFYVDNVLVGSWKPQAGGANLSLITNIRTAIGSTTTLATFKYHYMGLPLAIAIGDSITAGATKHAANPDHYAGIDDYSNNYPRKISDFLRLCGVKNYFVVNKGVNGETTAQFVSRFNADVVNNSCKYVFIQGGVNDYLSEDPTPTANNKKSMADTAVANAITPIILGITPVKSAQITKPFAISLRNLEDSGVYGTHKYIKLWDSINLALSADDADPIYMIDNTHPNLLGYEKIGFEIIKGIAQ